MRRLTHILLLIVLVTTSLVTFWHPTVSAAALDTSPWYDTQGNTISVNDKSTISSRFSYIDTDNIKDTTTGTIYSLNGSITHTNPAIAAAQNTTENGTFSHGPDDIYEKYNSPSRHPDKFYWYWPSGKAPTQVTSGSAVNGTTFCAGGILATTEVADGPTYVFIHFIPAVPSQSNNTDCKTYGGSSITTGETSHTGLRSSYTTERNDIHDKKNPIQTLQATGSKASDYATYLDWQDSQTVTLVNGSATFQLISDKDAISVIQGHLSHGKENANKYATGYDYFGTNACVSNGGPSVILAVKSDDPSKSKGYLLHDNKPGGEPSGGDAYANWWGKSFACAFGYDGVDDNPYQSFQVGWSDAVASDVTALIGHPENAFNAPNPSTPPIDLTGGTGGSGSTGAPKLSCKATNGILGTIFSLNWILCPLIGGFTDIIGFVDNAITNQLLVGSSNGTGTPSKIFCNDATCKAYHQAWASFRNISLGLLVIGGLVMLIAQVLGFEVLDAYTLRKVAPRIFIVAIGITLSWQLMEFMITLTNDLGLGVRNIILYPFSSLGTDTIKLGGAGFATTLVGGIAAFSIGLVGLLAMVAAGAMVLLMAFAVLVLRQIAIIMLLVLAPVAIACYILPNTQKVYHIWWESFSKALLMFPIIAGLIAAGHAFSLIASKDTGTISQFAAFGAYFAPYFLIPATFKMAGGAIRQLGGFVNDRSRGALDGLRGVRQRNSKRRREMYAHKFQHGDFSRLDTRSKGLNAVANTLVGAANYTGTHASAGWRGGYGFGESGRRARGNTLLRGLDSAMKEKGMQGAAASSNAFNRYMVLTAKNHGNYGQAEADLRAHYSSKNNEYGRVLDADQVEEKVSEAKGFMRAAGGYNAGRAAAAAINMGRDGTAIRDVQDMGRVAAWVSEGDDTIGYQLLSQISSDSGQRNRFDLSVAQDHKAALIGATTAEWASEEGKTLTTSQAKALANYQTTVDGATMSGAGSTDAYTVLSRSPSRVIRGNVEKEMELVQRHMRDPNSVSFDDAAKAAAKIQALKSNVDYGVGTEDNKSTFRDAMAEDGRMTILENFMRTPVQQKDGSQVMGGDVVKHLAGERYASMTPEQLAEARARGEFVPEPSPDDH